MIAFNKIYTLDGIEFVSANHNLLRDLVKFKNISVIVPPAAEAWPPPLAIFFASSDIERVHLSERLNDTDPEFVFTTIPISASYISIIVFATSLIAKSAIVETIFLF
jgi:hypothetical protein